MTYFYKAFRAGFLALTCALLGTLDASAQSLTALPASSALSGAGTAYGISLGNYDNDADLDVFWGVRGSANKVLRNDGAGGLTLGFTFPGSDATMGSATGDFNNDGWTDVVFGNAYLNNSNCNSGCEEDAVYLNDQGASPTFSLAWTDGLGRASWHVAVGDFDNDGFDDFAAASASGGASTIWINDSVTNGVFAGFTQAVIPSGGPNTRGVAVGDINGDIFPDVVFGDGTILISDGTGGFSRTSVASSGSAHYVGIGQMDGANGNDLVFSGDRAGQAQVFLDNGAGGYVGQTVAGNTTDVRFETALADINNDGVPDLVSVGFGAGFDSAFISDGSGGLTASGGLGWGGKGLAVGDMDGDGDDDVVTADPNRVFRNDLAPFSTSIFVNTLADTATAGDTFCSLREAITNANLVGGGDGTGGDCAPGLIGIDTIEFAIPGVGPHTLSFADGVSLPAITQPVYLNGCTQTGATCAGNIEDYDLRIALDAREVPTGPSTVGLSLAAGSNGSTIRGIVLAGFTHPLRISSSNHLIERVYGGTNFAGTARAPRRCGRHCIYFASGSGTIVENSLFSASREQGLHFEPGATGNTVRSNRLGTTADGRSRLLSGDQAIGLNQADGNFIIENTIVGEIRMAFGAANSNVIQGNWIGTNPEGDDLALGAGIGIKVGTGSNNLIGGPGAGEANTIAYHATGVTVGNAGTTVASGNRIQRNSFVQNGVGIDLIGDVNAGAGNNNIAAPSLAGAVIDAAGNLQVIVSAASAGEMEAFLAEFNRDEGSTYLPSVINYVTPGAEATFSLGSAAALGVSVGDDLVATITDGSDNTSEFTTRTSVQDASGFLTVTNAADAGFGSLRAAVEYANATANGVDPDEITFAIPGLGSDEHSISLTSALPPITDPVVIDALTQGSATCGSDMSGRDLRVFLDGTAAGSGSGIEIQSGGAGSTIRGFGIANFAGAGIHILNANSNLVECNNLGTNLAGTAVLGNGGAGLNMTGSSEGNQIGAAFRGNLMTGNGANEIHFEPGADNNFIRANYFGTDIFGEVLAGRNTLAHSSNGASGNLYGGSGAGEGNLFRGSSFFAAEISRGDDNVFHGNSFVDNGRTLVVSGAPTNPALNNEFGGDLPGEGNTFTNNANAIQVYPNAFGTLIRRNSFTSNGIDIDLGADGISANDAGDVDAGPNNLQNYPVIQAAELLNGADLRVTYSIDTDVTSPIDIEFLVDGVFLDLGSYPSDTYQVAGAGNRVVVLRGAESIGASLGSLLQATATDAQGNTSELSGPATIEAVALVTDMSDDFDDDVLTTNTLGTGSGFASIGQGTVTENAGTANFTSSGAATFAIESNDAFDPFAGDPTTVTWVIEDVGVTLPSFGNRTWVGIRPAGLPASGTESSFMPTYGALSNGVYIAVNHNRDGRFPSSHGIVQARIGGNAYNLAQFEWSTYTGRTPLTVSLTTNGDTYSVDFSEAVTLSSGSLSGTIPGNPSSADYVAGVHYQGLGAAGTLKLDSVTMVKAVAPAPADGLIAHYRGEGNTLNELGAAYPANWGDPARGVAGQPTYSAGFSGDAFAFGGTGANGNSGNFLTVAALGGLGTTFGTGSFSFSAWVNPSSCPRECQIASTSHHNVTGGWELRMQSTGGQTVFTYRTGSGPQLSTPTAVFPFNVWTHVAVTYDAVSGVTTLYKGGVAVGSNSAPGGITPLAGAKLVIGENNNWIAPARTWGPWIGGIDEVRVYSKAISAAEVAAQVSVSNPLLVTTAADTGTGSLRAAITYSNANPGAVDPNEITFDIDLGGASSAVIRPATALPAITEPLVINGISQTGATCGTGIGDRVIKIVLDGSDLAFVNGGPNADALTVGNTVANVTIQGLSINQFPGAGIGVSNGTDGVVIRCNYIGTDETGLQAFGNRDVGIRVAASTNVLIQDNLISGNGEAGIFLGDGTDGATVVGNTIGLTQSGALIETAGALESNLNGIIVSRSSNNVIGGTLPGEGNNISGNRGAGVIIEFVTATGNRVEGNTIGTSEDGLTARGNQDDGVRIWFGANNNVVGGSVAARNIISGNGGHGVGITEPSGDAPFQVNQFNTVSYNYIGLDQTGEASMANQRAGVRLDRGSAVNTVASNVISGNVGTGVSVTCDLKVNGIRVFPCVVNSDNSVTNPTHRNLIANNILGLSASQSIALGNGREGVSLLFTVRENTVTGNVISGNALDGVVMFQPGDDNVVKGNFIGTDDSGAIPFGNANNGIRIGQGGIRTLIGSTNPGDGNLIAHNGKNGISVSVLDNAALFPSVTISGNAIRDNGLLGIDLDIDTDGNRFTFDGFTANDPGDGDDGPNGLKNFPVLEAANLVGTTLTVQYRLDVNVTSPTGRKAPPIWGPPALGRVPWSRDSRRRPC
jgi:CSLREA domain-containing protein